MRALTVLFAIVLSGCASQVLNSYVGKPVTEAMLDYGAPSNVIDLEDGRRAYQWTIHDTGTVAVPTTSTATVYGAGGTATAFGQSTSYVPYSETCVYTLTASQQGKAWIVDGFRKPRLACE
ncbi:hypothetical protein [Rhodovulum kholense]|uniref:Peptidase A2 domain-containing protein n=1 Tax=Rhodovulum kholense TaxID=453584 RepID=A0A8E3APZ2_9RHOB|nr:hypothetical protein [Rhodovulum kholense]PTW46049.1 hypothetical protein C8N38_1125 [Rhodovulum kholense]